MRVSIEDSELEEVLISTKFLTFSKKKTGVLGCRGGDYT